MLSYRPGPSLVATRPLTSTDKYPFVRFVFWSVASLSQKPYFTPLIQVFGDPVKICESARDSRRERQYKPKPNRGKYIRFGLFSCLSQIHFYCNDYNLRSFILNFAYNFTLADI